LAANIAGFIPHPLPAAAAAAAGHSCESIAPAVIAPEPATNWRLDTGTAHLQDLRGARQKGFEPLTFGSVVTRLQGKWLANADFRGPSYG